MAKRTLYKDIVTTTALAKYRISQGLTQEEMAKQLGANKNTYNNWEYRKRVPREILAGLGVKARNTKPHVGKGHPSEFTTVRVKKVPNSVQIEIQDKEQLEFFERAATGFGLQLRKVI